jgi:hypothetical protein
MRITSIILLLFACTGNLSAGNFVEIKNTGGKYTIKDTSVKSNRKSIVPGLTENKKDELIFSNELLKKIMEEKKAVSFYLGKSKKDQNIEAWFFPGTSQKKALVIGGVHGSELSSVEVAQAFIQKLLQKEKSYYNVIIIPCLFPDNSALAKEKKNQIGSTANIGRYSFSAAVDPNRQMPTPGEPFYEDLAKDHFGREIEQENRLLLQLINSYKPERIASVHAIRDVTHAGIYADPRTDSKGYALGFETDSMLAIEMSKMIKNSNGFVPGNFLEKKPTALYFKDPVPVAKGEFQERNFSGSILPGNRGSGISLGTWASTAIASATDSSLNRNAMRILTIEFPGYKRSADYKVAKQKNYFHLQVQLYASAIENIFLEKYFIEENEINRAENLASAE